MSLNPQEVRNEIESLRRAAPEVWGDEDEKLLTDMLEAQTSLNEFLTVLVDRMQDASSMAGALQTRMTEMHMRQDRYVAKEKALRALALSLMQQACVPKVELPEATLSVRAGSRSVKIVDEAAVPDAFCKFVRSPDKTRINEYLSGAHTMQPNWAKLETGPDSLAVRTK